MSCFNRALLLALVSALAASTGHAQSASPARANPDAAGPASYSALAVRRRPPGQYPMIGGQVRFEIENSFTYNAADRDRDRGRRRNSLFATFEPAISVELNESISIFTELQLEPVLESKADNQEFDDEGVFTEQLYLQWKGERLGLQLGKFEPTFGRSFEASRQIFGDEYAFDYEEFSNDTELTERVGGRVSYDFGDDHTGTQVLSFDLFDSDTSNLSRSALRGRGRLRRNEGGPSNSGRVKSFGLNLVGEDIPALPRFTYHLGFVYQDSGRVERLADEADAAIDPARTGRPQRSYVAGLGYGFPVSPAIDVRLFSEFLYLGNADGERNRIRTLLTVAAAAVVEKNLYVGFSYGRRTDRRAELDDHGDYLLQSTVTYYRALGRSGSLGRLGLELALRESRQEGERIGAAGLRLIWLREF
jgi:hypothetical protein